jgi:hypothetical protein
MFTEGSRQTSHTATKIKSASSRNSRHYPIQILDESCHVCASCRKKVAGVPLNSLAGSPSKNRSEWILPSQVIPMATEPSKPSHRYRRR